MNAGIEIVDVGLDIFEEIKRLKIEKNAVILAHYYQDADIQDVADFIGDSLALAQQAAKAKENIILFAGVHFMAETAKILNPSKKVLLPDLRAGCSLADSCPADKFEEFKKQYPGCVVISYINCSAEVKALSDIICTSSNAEKIINSVSKDKKIIFAPDKNLGAFLVKKTGRDMILWNGSCMVHEIFSLEKISHLKQQHPKAKLIAHPECEEPILKIADMVGSTSAMLKFTQQDNGNEYIVATETGILHQMMKASPHKTFIPAPPNNACACNDCPHMKLNTLEKLYACLKNEKPEIVLTLSLMQQAEAPIRRMLEISAN
ncbi:MAG TPA: quinolinate synthase NadA [Bacteroidia bacterium]|jgi:quinolinate synthase|nr:quinolinate synthase NadA [Bacteroidia bacterium]